MVFLIQALKYWNLANMVSARCLGFVMQELNFVSGVAGFSLKIFENADLLDEHLKEKVRWRLTDHPFFVVLTYVHCIADDAVTIFVSAPILPPISTC